MKKINIILLVLTITTIFYSCENDGGDSVYTLDNGAVPNMIKDSSTDAFLDLVKIQSGDAVSVSFSAEIAQGNPVTTDIVGVYKTTTGSVYSATLFSNVTLPQDFTVTPDDVVSAFSELSSTSDLSLADVLTITTAFTTADGTVINIIAEDGTSTLSSNVATSALFTPTIDYPISCPSDIGGNYTVVSSGFSTDGAPVNNPLVNFSYDIVLTDNGGGSYTISDGVAGVYQDWYCAPYGYCFETEGNFVDVCGILTGTWTEAFGCPINLTGVVNSDGTLTIEWSNCFGDTIEEAIYTPQ